MRYCYAWTQNVVNKRKLYVPCSVGGVVFRFVDADMCDGVSCTMYDNIRCFSSCSCAVFIRCVHCRQRVDKFERSTIVNFIADTHPHTYACTWRNCVADLWHWRLMWPVACRLSSSARVEVNFARTHPLHIESDWYRLFRVPLLSYRNWVNLFVRKKIDQGDDSGISMETQSDSG